MTTEWTDDTVTTSNNTLGNFNRFVDADPLADSSGGIDFHNTFSTENPWVFTTAASVVLSETSRNDPV